MIVHGHYPTELLKLTIVSIPEDNTASLSNSHNYRGISMFNSIHKLFNSVCASWNKGVRRIFNLSHKPMYVTHLRNGQYTYMQLSE